MHQPIIKSDSRIIGGYRLDEKIGEGAMGRVYRARKVGALHDFALKLIEFKLEDDERVARAESEILALSQFEHPHIVGLIDAFRYEGCIAIVMEYLDAQSLDEIITQISPCNFMKVFAQIASALAVLHRAGIIHRDVKPSNILVTWPDSSDEPHAHLIDFGICADVDSPPDDHFVGTPAYSGPESVDGMAATPATDVFALAAVAYYAIVGMPPFRADTVQSSLEMHLDWTGADFDPADTVEFSPDFGELVSAMLHPDPWERPTMSDACTLLSAFKDRANRGSRHPLDQSETLSNEPSEATVEVSNLSGRRAWVENGFLYVQDGPASAARVIDTQGYEPTTFMVSQLGVNYAVDEFTVHSVSDSGVRRIRTFEDTVVSIEAGDESIEFIVETRCGTRYACGPNERKELTR